MQTLLLDSKVLATWLPPTSLLHLTSTLLRMFQLPSFLTFVQSQLIMLWVFTEAVSSVWKDFPQIVSQMTVSFNSGLWSYLTPSKKPTLANKPQAANLLFSIHCCFPSFTTRIAISYFVAYVLPVFLPNNLYSLRSWTLPESLIVVSLFARHSACAQ